MIDDGRNFSLIFRVSLLAPTFLQSLIFRFSYKYLLLLIVTAYLILLLADNTDPIALKNTPMDSNSSGFLLNSVYYQSKEDDGIIDLGLSLRTLQPETYHPSGHMVGLEGYGELMEWPQENVQMNSNRRYQGIIREGEGDVADDEAEGIQSKERWAYVKVNMDGVLVGRKVCILDHSGYTSLACQLEDMFGRNSASGLRLFQADSEFSLFYKDREENWRSVGDVPWKEFVESVKRLKIARN